MSRSRPALRKPLLRNSGQNSSLFLNRRDPVLSGGINNYWFFALLDSLLMSTKPGPGTGSRSRRLPMANAIGGLLISRDSSQFLRPAAWRSGRVAVAHRNDVTSPLTAIVGLPAYHYSDIDVLTGRRVKLDTNVSATHGRSDTTVFSFRSLLLHPSCPQYRQYF